MVNIRVKEIGKIGTEMSDYISIIASYGDIDIRMAGALILDILHSNPKDCSIKLLNRREKKGKTVTEHYTNINLQVAKEMSAYAHDLGLNSSIYMIGYTSEFLQQYPQFKRTISERDLYAMDDIPVVYFYLSDEENVQLRGKVEYDQLLASFSAYDV